MHLLFVTPTLPIPISGGRTRIFNLIKQLAARHQISVVSFIEPAERHRLDDVRVYCAHLQLVPFEGFPALGGWQNRIQGWRRILLSRRPRYVSTFPVDDMRATLRELVGECTFDLAVFESLFLVELSREIGSVPALLVEQNVESDIKRRALQHASNPVHLVRDWLVWRKLRTFEQRWVRRFPVCAAVSKRDADRLREIAPQTEIHMVPNGVDVQRFAPRGISRDDNTLLFFGTLSYGPNVDALVWFCEEIWPAVREQRPRVRLEVVGLDPSARVTALDKVPGVDIVGFVPDIRSKLWSATACVVPLRTGGGTRLKILEALAAGCPVVSTSIGAEGLSVVDGAHLLVADAPPAFAQRVIDLLDSPELRQRLATNGCAIVRQEYDWSSIARLMEKACVRAVDLHGRGL